MLSRKEFILNNLTLHHTWNVIDSSKLILASRCMRRFFYEYVLGWRPDYPNNHLVFGTAWHEGMEHLLLTDYSSEEVTNAYNKFETSYRTEFSPESDEDYYPKTPLNALTALALYTNKYPRDHEEFKTIYTEIAGVINISEKGKLHFRMDSVLENKKTGMKLSREHKTGSRVFMWPEQWDLSIQVGTYSHVLYSLYPFEEVSGIELNGTFFIKRKKNPIDFLRYPLRRTKDQMDVWLSTVNYWYDSIMAEFDMLSDASENEAVLNAFPLNSNDCQKYYKMCPYHDFCLSWPNPLRRIGEPPLGFKTEFWDPREREATKTFELGA